MKKNSVLNKMVVFDRPLYVEDTTVYGILYNSDNDNHSNMSDYIAYLVGCEYFEKNNGVISDGGDLWYLPDGVHAVSCNGSLFRLLGSLLKGIVGFHTFETNEPIEWNDGEVDDDRGGSCFILKPELIERYTAKSDAVL